ncbi:hypothetical protein AF72_06790 [Xylella taiwanensis]|uniref:Uncharacterized protein n=1 Tax=Xylella taiwanensis TaxID=1444770 RepID=Z9JJ53_9GAMM|nr:hypothetical protein AF72_06790 [Xylella taiwanensis]
MIVWITNIWLAPKLLARQMCKQIVRQARYDPYPAPYAMIRVYMGVIFRHV